MRLCGGLISLLHYLSIDQNVTKSARILQRGLAASNYVAGLFAVGIAYLSFSVSLSSEAELYGLGEKFTPFIRKSPEFLRNIKNTAAGKRKLRLVFSSYKNQSPSSPNLNGFKYYFSLNLPLLATTRISASEIITFSCSSCLLKIATCSSKTKFYSLKINLM